MVFAEMKILRPSRTAARTSASQTKSAVWGAGSGEGGGAGVVEQDAPAPVLVSQLNPVFSPPERRERNRSTTSAAICETVDEITLAVVEMPRAAR